MCREWFCEFLIVKHEAFVHGTNFKTYGTNFTGQQREFLEGQSKHNELENNIVELCYYRETHSCLRH